MITAQGSGSKNTLSLDSGYANIWVNGNYYEGPSLHYKLRPVLTIWTDQAYQQLDDATLIAAFNENEMTQLSATKHPLSFRSVLETMALVDSKQDFSDRFGENSQHKLELIPYENAVYRSIFGSIILMAVMMSAAFQKRNTDDAIKPNNRLEATA